MKRYLIFTFICIFILSLKGKCQEKPSTITVIGKSKYSKNHIGYKAIIEIEDESNKCDSKYPMSSEEKLGHLLTFNKAGYFNFDKFLKIEKFDNVKSKMSFECHIKDSLHWISFIHNCDQLGINIVKKHYYFGPKNYEDEYEQALSAYNNAYDKALSYSKILGVKIKNIAYIDDFTTFYDSQFETKKSYNDKNLGLFRLANYRSILDKLREISLNPVYEYSYTLKVVFEVE